MITADTLATLTTFTAPALTRAIQAAGYPRDEFTTAEFVGMTNGGDFCYRVTYWDNIEGSEQLSKVFLRWDPTANRVIADY